MAARTYAEAGISRSLYGLILTGPVDADVHIVARSALGDDYAQPERVVTGNPHPTLATNDRQRMKQVKPDSLASAEQYIAALIVDAAPQEVASVSLYHLSGKKNASSTVSRLISTTGSAIFCYIREPL